MANRSSVCSSHAARSPDQRSKPELEFSSSASKSSLGLSRVARSSDQQLGNPNLNPSSVSPSIDSVFTRDMKHGPSSSPVTNKHGCPSQANDLHVALLRAKRTSRPLAMTLWHASMGEGEEVIRHTLDSSHVTTRAPTTLAQGGTCTRQDKKPCRGIPRYFPSQKAWDGARRRLVPFCAF